ncbi:MAG: extracellular solute-binding protein, partial [Schaalia hyovaginalis]
MTRHRLAPAFAALLLTGTALLGACSNPAATTDSSSSSGSASTERWPDATVPLNGTTLKIWAAQTSNKIPTKVIEDFEKATGGKVEVVTVPDNYESNVQTKIATGERPDLLFWQPVRSTLAGFVAQDLLQDLEGAPWVDDYADGIADAGGTYDGKRYAALISSPDV